ncbi:hypothetical protein ACFPVT_00310 [Corynebacterium choanae]|nr:hypothetical protein [Corynebacterium choanae]
MEYNDQARQIVPQTTAPAADLEEWGTNLHRRAHSSAAKSTVYGTEDAPRMLVAGGRLATGSGVLQRVFTGAAGLAL